MAKVSIAPIANLQNESSAVGTINANFEAIQEAIEKTLSRDGTSPNALDAPLDANEQRIINLPTPVDYTDAARHGDLQKYVDDAEAAQLAAEVAQIAAETAQGITEGFRDETEGFRDTTQGLLDDFNDKYIGAYASGPAGPHTEGAIYFDTVVESMFIWQSGLWVQCYSALDGAVIEAPDDGVLYARRNEVWEALPERLSIVDKDDNYVLQLSDAQKYVRVSNASPVSVTVPDNEDVAFPIGTSIIVRQVGAGQVSLVEDTAVTINTPETLLLRKQGSTVTLVKVGENEWDVMGDLEAA